MSSTLCIWPEEALSWFFIFREQKEEKHFPIWKGHWRRNSRNTYILSYILKYWKLWNSVCEVLEFQNEGSRNSCWQSLRTVLELFFTPFFKRKANKIQSVFINGLWKKPAIPLSFSAFPVYVGSWVEVLWRQKTFWNVEKKVSCKSSKLLQDFRIWTLRGASYFFFWGMSPPAPLLTRAVKLSNLVEDAKEWQNTCGFVQVSVFAWTSSYCMLTGCIT